MPRKTRRQLVGKQELADELWRDNALRELACELHRMQIAKNNSSPSAIEPKEALAFLSQAEIKILTVHS